VAFGGRLRRLGNRRAKPIAMWHYLGAAIAYGLCRFVLIDSTEREGVLISV